MNTSTFRRASLITLFCFPVYAASTTDSPNTDANAITSQSKTSTSTAATSNNNLPTPSASTPTIPASPATPPTGTPRVSPPTDSTPGGIPAPSSDNPLSSNAPSSPTVVDCNYHIGPETTKIDQALVLQWAQKAIQQTFSLDPDTMDTQLENLKACYTEQGWKSYIDAFKKSGNLDAIKSQKLNVSSLIDGQPLLTTLKDNQWKVIIPLDVVYQNAQEKISQTLTINLIISRKVSGDLGIIQVVAAPRQTANPVPNKTANSTETKNNAPSDPATEQNK